MKFGLRNSPEDVIANFNFVKKVYDEINEQIRIFDGNEADNRLPNSDNIMVSLNHNPDGLLSESEEKNAVGFYNEYRPERAFVWVGNKHYVNGDKAELFENLIDPNFVQAFVSLAVNKDFKI